MGIQYFKVDVERNLALSTTFNLRVFRLIKEKEARESGFAPHDQWTYMGEMKGVDERNAMCLISMIETPREPLQNKEEEALWLSRVPPLKTSAVNMPHTNQVPT